MQSQRSRDVNPTAHGASDIEDEDRTAPGVKPGAKPAASAGFRAKLSGVGLWDLVQMECLAGSRTVVLVTGEAGIGYMYFDRGQIVHAVTADYVGEQAALEILGWTNGSFQVCDRPWPEAGSIVTSHEALILEAARRRDESERSNLVSFRRTGRAPVTEEFPAVTEQFEDLDLTELEEEGATAMRSSNIEDETPAANGARGDIGSGDFQVMLRLAASGAVVRSHGASEEQAELIAYVKRLVDLTGELLGLDDFTALEFVFAGGRCVMFTDTNGDTVVLRPKPETNLQPIRERLGL
jgi:Domain of unknown function (DUF4388)